MKDKRKRKPYFSERGNPEDYDYMGYQLKFIIWAVIFVLCIAGIVELGIYDALLSMLR